MKLPKDFMGHDLELIQPIKGRSAWNDDLVCRKCKIKIFPNDSGNYFYNENSGWMKMMTCDEFIIKNIIE